MREVCGAPGPRIIGSGTSRAQFLAPERMGHARRARAVNPIPRSWSDCWPQAPVRLMTLAPGAAGRYRADRPAPGGGVRVSLGHTNATAEEANAAFDRGVGTVTHLFNAMRPSAIATPALRAPRSRAATSSSS